MPETPPIPLDPWTVYGELSAGENGWPTRINVPDIGVLPPPGRYFGTLQGESGSVSVRATVPARAADGQGFPRPIDAEVVGRLGMAVGSIVALRFEAIEAATLEPERRTDDRHIQTVL